jgi:ribosome modulation factor
MGEVYRAEDTNLSRDVAIKVLPEQFTKDPQRLARFEREAKHSTADSLTKSWHYKRTLHGKSPTNCDYSSVEKNRHNWLNRGQRTQRHMRTTCEDVTTRTREHQRTLREESSISIRQSTKIPIMPERTLD